MIWQSIPLMIIVDLMIIAVTAWCFKNIFNGR